MLNHFVTAFVDLAEIVTQASKLMMGDSSINNQMVYFGFLQGKIVGIRRYSGEVRLQKGLSTPLRPKNSFYFM